jgi:hypothetical protein
VEKSNGGLTVNELANGIYKRDVVERAANDRGHMGVKGERWIENDAKITDAGSSSDRGRTDGDINRQWKGADMRSDAGEDKLRFGVIEKEKVR